MSSSVPTVTGSGMVSGACLAWPRVGFAATAAIIGRTHPGRARLLDISAAARPTSSEQAWPRSGQAPVRRRQIPCSDEERGDIEVSFLA